MQNEIIINAELGETRIALIEKGEFNELHIERERDKSVVGNVVKGRVMRVLPGMQAAFVDVGLPRAAFLYVDDVLDTRTAEDHEHRVASDEEARESGIPADRESPAYESQGTAPARVRAGGARCAREPRRRRAA